MDWTNIIPIVISAGSLLFSILALKDAKKDKAADRITAVEMRLAVTEERVNNEINQTTKALNRLTNKIDRMEDDD